MPSRDKSVPNPTHCEVCSVRKLALFRPVPTEHLASVQNFRAGQRLVAGQHDLYREGTLSGEVYTLYDGWVMRYKTLEDGRRQILSFALPGDFIGFQPELTGANSHSAQTLTPSTVCVFPKQNLLSMFKEYPELAIQMSWISACDESITQEHLISLGRRPARERIAHLLLELCARMDARRPRDNRDTLPLPLTQEHIADAVGLTTIHVNRTLRVLREAGLLEIHSGHLRLLNRRALEEMTGFRVEAFAPRPMV